MKDIVLTRIDDRLIHGQFVTAWLKYIEADTVLIIDDELSINDFMKRIYKASMPANIELLIYNYEDTKEFLSKYPESKQKVIILVKTPIFIEKLIKDSIDIKEIILGGMGAKDDRKKVIKNIYASQIEIDCMSRILGYNTKIFYQLVPRDKKVDISKKIKESVVS